MPLWTPESCLRGRSDCKPLANLYADDQDENGTPVSFICVGLNDGSERQFEQDEFTHCWHSAGGTDDRYFMDKRDLIDTVSVFAQALSHQANTEVSAEISK